MSFSVYIYLVRGVKLQEQDLCVEGKPQCLHKIPEAANFCPVCGKTVARQWEERPEYKDMDGEPTLCGFNVVRGGTDYNDIYVGEIVAELGHYDEANAILLTIPEPLDVVQRLRNALEPLGLWNLDAFGVWLVRQISY